MQIDNEVLNILSESEFNSYRSSKIDFESFAGSIELYGNALPQATNVLQIELGSSSRSPMPKFEKPVEIKLTKSGKDRKIEYEAEYARIENENKNDILELIAELKPLCDEFDKKIEALLASKGYKKV